MSHKTGVAIPFSSLKSSVAKRLNVFMVNNHKRKADEIEEVEGKLYCPVIAK